METKSINLETKRSKNSRTALLIIYLIIFSFLFEGTRAGYISYFNGYTPKLFRIIKASSLEGKDALIVFIVGLLLAILFIGLFLKLLLKGNLKSINKSKDNLILEFNGLVYKEKYLLLTDITKVNKNKESANVNGMRVTHVKFDIELANNKKVFLISYRDSDKQKISDLSRFLNSVINK